jgi:hypothetical protein
VGFSAAPLSNLRELNKKDYYFLKELGWGYSRYPQPLYL